MGLEMVETYYSATAEESAEHLLHIIKTFTVSHLIPLGVMFV